MTPNIWLCILLQTIFILYILYFYCFLFFLQVYTYTVHTQTFFQWFSKYKKTKQKNKHLLIINTKILSVLSSEHLFDQNFGLWSCLFWLVLHTCCHQYTCSFQQLILQFKGQWYLVTKCTSLLLLMYKMFNFWATMRKITFLFHINENETGRFP